MFKGVGSKHSDKENCFTLKHRQLYISQHYTRGDPKISGIVTKIYLKYFYKFVTSVPFKVLPL
jgi:hypothetical protein